MSSLIGDRIKILRLNSNLTQEELALKLGLNSKSSIANYEANNNSPSDEIKIAICKLFHCSMDYLMGLTSNTETIETHTNRKQRKLEQILDFANGLTIQEANCLIKRLSKAKIRIEEDDK